MECWILRTNGTVKKTRINDKQDSFTFEDGTYFVIDKHIINRRFLYFFYRPMLIYKEGFSEPISFDNLVKKKIKKKIKNEKTGKTETIEVEDETILIDAFSIHNLSDRKILGVLTDNSLTKADLLLIFLVVISIIASIAGAMQ